MDLENVQLIKKEKEKIQVFKIQGHSSKIKFMNWLNATHSSHQYAKQRSIIIKRASFQITCLMNSMPSLVYTKWNVP